jgi:hypothetical protein
MRLSAEVSHGWAAGTLHLKTDSLFHYHTIAQRWRLSQRLALVKKPWPNRLGLLLSFPAMTYYEFNVSSSSYQIALTVTEGVELARRQENTCQATLYYMPDNFFVELHRDTRTGEITKMRSFKHSTLLERYVSQLQLPEWLA